MLLPVVVTLQRLRSRAGTGKSMVCVSPGRLVCLTVGFAVVMA